MTARSQNGWSANDRSVIASYDVPGGRLALRAGDASVVLLWVTNQFHERVEPLEWPGVWGYAERPIRGSSTTLSNHASGCAVDLNAPDHPLGTDPEDNFTDDQIREIREIVAYCEGVVRWGGSYSGRKDPMHFEIVAGAAAVRRVADKIRNGQEDELSQQQVDQIIGQFRRDLGFARDQILTRLGVSNPSSAPPKLTPEQLAGIDPARRVDVGFARDQFLSELAAQRALVEAQGELLAKIAEKVGLAEPEPAQQERTPST